MDVCGDGVEEEVSGGDVGEGVSGDGVGEGWDGVGGVGGVGGVVWARAGGGLLQGWLRRPAERALLPSRMRRRYV